ncbi:MAG TPA: methyltransferase domain-containing protein [Candidatus Dormibacteraeota bacterium]|nr:methyltransferase domain-containing protein [Candidatus Dormibacteraeota bacterium]
MPVAEFDQDYFDRLRAARDHWWVRGMQDVGTALLGAGGRPMRVLDAGCGVGSNSAWLTGVSAGGTVTGIDVASAAVAVWHQSGAPDRVLQASVTSLPFAGSSFDLVVSLDVLQHLGRDDAGRALQETRRVLAPGGRLLIRTNARFGRRSVAEREDWRLYEPATLRDALTSAGLAVDHVTPVNALQGLWASLPRVRLGGRHGGAHGNDGHAHQHADAGPHTHGLGIPRPAPRLRNEVLLRSLRAEALWLRGSRRRLPFGHSLYALAHRRDDH